MSFDKLEILGIGNDLLEEACVIVSFTVFFFTSFLTLMGFADQLMVTFERQTFFPAFVVACSNSLPVLKSIIAN